MAWKITENGAKLTVAFDGRLVAAVAPNLRDDVLGRMEKENKSNVLFDLSKMTLQVNDLTKLNRENRYTIATLSGGIANGALFKSTNLPAGWKVRYYPKSHELQIVPERGTRFILL